MTIEYDQSVAKYNKNGDVVLSNTLEKGEKLITGATYKDEQKRLGKAPEGSPFAQGSLIEHNNPTDPIPGLTVTSDGVNTRRQDDLDPEPAPRAPFEPELVATTDDEGSSTVITTPSGETPATGSESEYVDPPKDSDSKQEWFDYATKHKGLKAEYDDITKNEIIAFVGEQK